MSVGSVPARVSTALEGARLGVSGLFPWSLGEGGSKVVSWL